MKLTEGIVKTGFLLGTLASKEYAKRKSKKLEKLYNSYTGAFKKKYISENASNTSQFQPSRTLCLS